MEVSLRYHGGIWNLIRCRGGTNGGKKEVAWRYQEEVSWRYRGGVMRYRGGVMEVSWRYQEDVMGVSWTYHEVSWRCHGGIMEEYGVS